MAIIGGLVARNYNGSKRLKVARILPDKYSKQITNEFVKFGEPIEGDDSEFVKELSGVLVSIDSIEMQGKQVGKYKIQNEETGVTKSFLGSAILDDLISSPDVEIGSDIKIIFTGVGKATGPGKSPIKQFELFMA